MKTLSSPFHEFFKKGDPILLLLCLLASAFGVALIFSATRYNENNQAVVIQIVAILEQEALGVIEGHGLPEFSKGIFGEIRIVVQRPTGLKRRPPQAEVQLTGVSGRTGVDRQGIFGSPLCDT